MAISPHVQRKAQTEIDRVIGSKRLPTLADRASLPYIEAIYREVMRFRPTIPLNVPHRLVEDDFYKGYFIPKGVSVARVSFTFLSIWFPRDKHRNKYLVGIFDQSSLFTKRNFYFDLQGYDSPRRTISGPVYIQTREIPRPERRTERR